jgi:steroid 5-alpha reductase family enzyme
VGTPEEFIAMNIILYTLAVAFAGYDSSKHDSLHVLVLLLVLIWSLRLGSFLFIRINKIKRDKRFDGTREHFFKFLRFWILQGVTVFIVLLGATFAFTETRGGIHAVSTIGAAVFLIGVVIEGFADSQKFSFNNNPSNKGKWIDVGVWRASRHPNYLGEMLVWLGMYVVVTPVLNGAYIWWALLSPVYIIVLLLFVSGIPLLEKSADKKWGTLQKYQAYKKAVPSLIPTLRSIARSIK